jgi:hypothetical protein
MGKADLHIHTIASPDGTATLQAVLESASQLALDVIAITDHDDIGASLEAEGMASRYPLRVIPGAEISTREGHLVALFIRRNIPAGLSLIETLVRIGYMGGLAIAAHPGQPIPNSLPLRSLRKAIAHPYAGRVLHGIEICNANPTHSVFNSYSRKAAERLPLARVASSDAHLASMIGAAITHFEGQTCLDLRRALERRMSRPELVNHESATAVFMRWLQAYVQTRLPSSGLARGFNNTGRPEDIKKPFQTIYPRILPP